MWRLRWERYNAGPISRLWASQPTLPRRRVCLSLGLLVLIVSALVLFTGPTTIDRVRQWLPWTPKPQPPSVVLEPDGPGFYEWETTSSFRPVSIEDKVTFTTGNLCSAFPSQLLSKVQPVLKTGHKLLQTRLAAQFHSATICLNNILIFSDTPDTYEGYRIIDIIADIPERLTKGTKALRAWRNGALTQNSTSAKQGWNVDKFKFLPSLSRAWNMRPDREWYVFFEDDTYVFWDGVFRLLEHFDPDEPHYFGSPTPGGQRSWFANGGPGYILSREAMRRFVRKDSDPTTGEYMGSHMTVQYWDHTVDDCCGDASLGWALWGQNVTIDGLFPMFNPLPPDDVSFTDSQWCQPLLTMHLGGEVEHAAPLWHWESKNRKDARPLLYRDLALSYFDFAKLETRDDWNNAQRDSFAPPTSGAHNSADTCEQACQSHEECFSWTYHLRRCHLVRAIRWGRPEGPGFTQDERSQGWFSTVGWKEEDTRFRAGWNVAKIRKWMDERRCETAQWVKPSTRRIF